MPARRQPDRVGRARPGSAPLARGGGRGSRPARRGRVAVRLEPVGEALVQVGTDRLGQGVVGGVADQLVPEAVGVLVRRAEAGPAGSAPCAPTRAAARRPAVSLGAARRWPRGGRSFPRSSRARAPTARPVRAGRGGRRGAPGSSEARRRCHPGCPGRARASPRGTAGFPRRRRRSVRGALRGASPSAADSSRALCRVERLEQDSRRVLLAAAPAGPPLEQFRPSRAEHEDRGVRDEAATCSTRSSSVFSAQCRSSSTQTTGWACASCSSSLRKPQAISRRRRDSSLSPSERAQRPRRVSCRQRPGLLENLDDRPVRDAVAVRETATAHDARIRPREELRREPRLAHASRAEHRDQLDTNGSCTAWAKTSRTRCSSCSRPIIGVENRRSSMPVAASSRYAATGFDFPFSGRADRPPRRRPQTLRAPVSACRSAPRPAAAACSSRAATLTASPVASRSSVPVTTSPVLTPTRPLMPELRERVAHLDRRPTGTEGVVLVRDRRSEHRHHRIADELLDRASMCLDDRLHPLEVASEQRPQCLRIGRLAERGRAGDVAKQHGYRLAHLALDRRVESRAAVCAARKPFRRLAAAAGADQHTSTLSSAGRSRKCRTSAERQQRAFVLEQEPLHRQAAAEAGQRTVGADHAVAREDERQRVLAVRRADGARLLRAVAEAARLLAVADGLAVRDGREREPALTLELAAVRSSGRSNAVSSPAKYDSSCSAASSRTGDAPSDGNACAWNRTPASPSRVATRPRGPIGLSTTVLAMSSITTRGDDVA